MKKLIPKDLRCPECNGKHVGPKGDSWKCYDCGRCWKEHRNRFVEMPDYKQYLNKGNLLIFK